MADGRDGRDGIDGERGPPGPRGLEGPQGPIGPQGPAGADGEDGRDGTDGAQGPAGEMGPRGPQGLPGIPGAAGLRGSDGADGARGPAGPQGPPGPRGEPGPMPAHRWQGTKLSFQNPDGAFDEPVDLRGPTGANGGGGFGAGDLPFLMDAPKDGSKYARQNGAWVTVTGGGGGADWGDIGGTLSNQTDLANALATKADTADLTAVATSGAYGDLSGRPALATVATTGAYADLSGRPTLGTAAATDATAYATAAQGTKADAALPASTAATTYAPLASPALTGNPTAPTPTAGDADTSIATTAFVDTSFAKKASPTFTGTVTVPTAATADNTTAAASTAFVHGEFRGTTRQITGTTDSPTSSDYTKIVECANASALTITLNSAGFTALDWIEFYSSAAGTVTFAAGAGVTIIPAAGTLRTTGSACVARYLGSSKWLLVGDFVKVPARIVTNSSSSATAGSAPGTDYVFFCTGTTTITLPTAVANTNQYIIKSISGTTNIGTTSSQTIDGVAAPTAVANGTAYTLISDGTNWRIV